MTILKFLSDSATFQQYQNQEASLLDVLTKQAVANTLSRTALTALTAPFDGQIAMISEGLRSGPFVWKSGDHSQFVSADVNQGIYIPSGQNISGSLGAWIRIFSGSINAIWFGALCDSVTDDTLAIQAALSFVPNGATLYLPTDAKITATLNIVNKTGVRLEGPGRLVQSTAFTFLAGANCTRLTIHGWGFDGSVKEQQYAVAVPSTAVSTAMDPSTWTLGHYFPGTADVSDPTTKISATKSGTVVSLALTGDAIADGIDRAVRSTAIALDSTAKHVAWIDDGFLSGSGGNGPVLFYKADGTEYDPNVRDSSQAAYNVLQSASFQFDLGTGKGNASAAYQGTIVAGYDLSKMRILKLVNDLAASSPTTVVAPYAVSLSGCVEAVIEDCTFTHLWGCIALSNDCTGTILRRNKGEFLMQGFNVTQCSYTEHYDNHLSGEFLDDTGIRYPQLYLRFKHLSGNMRGRNGLYSARNRYVGFNWGEEIISVDGTGAAVQWRGYFSQGNYLSSAYQPISVNYTADAEWQGDTIGTSYAFAVGLMEIAGPGSAQPIVRDCDLVHRKPFGKYGGGVGPSGDGARIINTRIRAITPITIVATALIRDCEIHDCLLEYTNSGFYIRNVEYKMFRTTVRCSGPIWIYTLGGPNTNLMQDVVAQFTILNSVAFSQITNCFFGGSLSGNIYDQSTNLLMSGNTIELDYAPTYALQKRFYTSETVTSVLSLCNNTFVYRGGFTSTILKGSNPPAGGTLTMTGNAGAGIASSRVNTPGITYPTFLGGPYATSFVANPGSIASGSSYKLASTVAFGDFSSSANMAASVDLKGCSLGIPYWDGAQWCAVITNNTGAAQTIANGSYFLEVQRK